jgi:hypothetical protein
MVGDTGGHGGSAARLTADLRAAYDTAAGGWGGGLPGSQEMNRSSSWTGTGEQLRPRLTMAAVRGA